jgi:hypothetical protein
VDLTHATMIGTSSAHGTLAATLGARLVTV